jgi:hypothetical protein
MASSLTDDGASSMRLRTPNAPSIALLLVVVCAACGGGGGGPASTPKRPPERFLITFEEANGPGGLPRVLTVHPSGLLELQPGTFEMERTRVPTREIVEVRELVSSPGFAALKSRYPAPAAEEFEVERDTLDYRVSVMQGTDVRTVMTDGAGNEPAILGRVLNELRRLRSFVEQQGT